MYLDGNLLLPRLLPALRLHESRGEVTSIDFFIYGFIHRNA